MNARRFDPVQEKQSILVNNERRISMASHSNPPERDFVLVPTQSEAKPGECAARIKVPSLILRLWKCKQTNGAALNTMDDVQMIAI